MEPFLEGHAGNGTRAARASRPPSPDAGGRRVTVSQHAQPMGYGAQKLIARYGRVAAIAGTEGRPYRTSSADRLVSTTPGLPGVSASWPRRMWAEGPDGPVCGPSGPEQVLDGSPPDDPPPDTLAL